MSSFQTVLVWAIVLAAVAGVLLRPRHWPEALWACLGAAALVIFGLVPIARAAAAIGSGADVYLFLTGMMLLAELARRNGVFDWVASIAVRASKKSRLRLFVLIYAAGAIVTIFLSNDATAVVLTPAVYAAVKRAQANPLPYLFICAFIANAASFVLPISNPANLVVYGKSIPPLAQWLQVFLLPSVASIAVTYFALRWRLAREIRGSIEPAAEISRLTHDGKLSVWGIAIAGVVLIAASAMGFDLGLPTVVAAAAAIVVTTRLRAAALRALAGGVSWSVLPLVAGLFVLVEGLNRAGGVAVVTRLFERCALPAPLAGNLAASFGIAALSNLMNNLPSGLLAGSALHAAHGARSIRNAVLIGVDLGPNLSVTGSLATVLWLIALRREGVRTTAWQFFKLGAVVMPPALLLAVIALSMGQR